MSVLVPIVDSWDGANRLIYLSAGVGDYFPIEDLYHEYRNARRLDETLRGFNPLLKAEGNVPKGAGAFTPRYVVLLDGTKIVPFNNTTQVNQLGDIITDDPDVDPLLYDISSLTVPKVIYIKPSEAETIQLNSLAIEYSSYDGGVTFDMDNISGRASAGTEYPIGTPRAPSNNFDDAAAIAGANGFDDGLILGNLTFDSGRTLAGFTFHGASKERTLITIPVTTTISDCTYMTATVTGKLEGISVIKDCVIRDLTGLCGFIERSVIDPGTIAISGAASTHFIDCNSGVPGVSTPIIDMGGTGNSLDMRGYKGGIKITNKYGPESVSIDLVSGQVIVDDTVTNGTIVLRGVGKWTNADTYIGGANVVNELVSGLKLSDVHDAHFKKRVWDNVGNTIKLYDADGVTVLHTFNTNADLSVITPV